MSAEPEPRPRAKEQFAEALPQPLAKPAAGAAGSPVSSRKTPGSRAPGEAYTPMTDFPEPAVSRWRYVAAAAALALALSFGYLKLKPPAPSHGAAATHAVSAGAQTPQLVPLDHSGGKGRGG